MKQPLKERFQQLAGIKPLYQIKKESMFDKVASMIKGNSDKEQAIIDALKKFGISLETPFYRFANVGGGGDDGSNAYFLKGSGLPADGKVPMPAGFNGEEAPKEALKIATINSVEEVDGVVMANMVHGQYNFKTGEFDEDEEEQFNMEDPTELEKELDPVDKDPGEQIYLDIEMVPYEGSIWEKYSK